MPRRYYHTDNASRAYTAGGFEFQFEPVALRAGAWSGLLATDDESAQQALSTLIEQNPAITEIGQEEFDAIQKKKTVDVRSSPSLREQFVLPKKQPQSVPPVVAPPPPAESSTGIELTELAPPEELSEVAVEPQKPARGKRSKS